MKPSKPVAKARQQRTRGQRVCAFIEQYCLIPDGEHLGKPFVLEPFQRKFILDIYDNPKCPTRRAILSIARKNGKTALIAALVLVHLVGPEAIRNTQITSGAQSREQAALVYELASKMVMMSEILRAIIRIVPSSKKLLGIPCNTVYHATSAEGKTALGGSPVLAILDEVGQVRGPQDAFIDAIVTSQGAHANPLLITISTQAPNDADLLSVWIDDAVQSKDPRIVCHVYTAPLDAPLHEESTWRAANPALGKFRSLADMREQSERATRILAFEPTFRNLALNQRVELFAPFVGRGLWVLNSMEPDASAFYESPVYVGIDLSGRVDLTAVVFAAQKEGRWHVKPLFWTPEKGLKERARLSRTPLDTWAKQGLIKVCPGAVIDLEVVAKDMMEAAEGMQLHTLCFDRWRIDLLKKELEKLGHTDLPLLPFGQGFRDMSPALELVESALLNEQVAHGAHPVLTMCAMNSRVEQDSAGNRKLSKLKSSGRIDGMVAMVMALGATRNMLEPPKPYTAIFL